MLKINKDIKIYSYYPENTRELKKLLKERIEEDRNANLNDICISGIESLNSCFENLNPSNIDISEWDVSNVKDMSYCFNWCNNFKCDLSNWDVSNVNNFDAMFWGCDQLDDEFCKGIEKWNINSKASKTMTFYGCINILKTPSWYKP